MTSSARSAYASVRIAGESLDPLEVTKALRLPPDHAHRNGEPNLRRRQRDGTVQEYSPYRQGLWSMSSERWVDAVELDVHICWLLDQLEPRAVELQRLREGGASADICCYWAGSSGPARPLPGGTLGRCMALSLPVEIDDSARNDSDRNESALDEDE